jgi:hypothetical protein
LNQRQKVRFNEQLRLSPMSPSSVDFEAASEKAFSGDLDAQKETLSTN